MSTFRFIHTDFLRLATPLSGVADSPAWLQEQAAGSVRNAVRNVADTAINQKVDFLLVAGSVTDSSEDLPIVIQWLDQVFSRLRQHGVQVVVHAENSHESAALASVCDLVLCRDEHLVAARTRGQACDVRKAYPGETLSHELVVTIGQTPSNAVGRTVYNAAPALHCSAEADCNGVNGYLSLSAGTVQAVSPDERLEHGCLIVEADTETRMLKSEFVATDVIRFAAEDLQLSSAVTMESLANAVASASDSIGRSSSATVVVDWHVSAELVTDFAEVSLFGEFELLHKLRNDVQSGHRGVWPRRLTFRNNASLRVTSPVLESVEEYIGVVNGAVNSYDVDHYTHTQRLLQGEPGVTPTLILGLSLLSRVA